MFGQIDGICGKLEVLRSVVETLEPRQLLSGYVLDTSFGDGGIVSGLIAASVRADGSLVAYPNTATAANVLVHPDGTLAPLPASLAPLAIPTPPQPNNVQADGKFYTVDPGTAQSINVLTRHNKNGTVDSSFGNNGHISDFATLSGNSTFNPSQAIVVGNRIYLIGSTIHNSPPEPLPSLAVLALKTDGSVDKGFAFFNANDDDGEPASWGSFAGLGADGTLYVNGFGGEQFFEGRTFWAFGPSGQLIGHLFNGDNSSVDSLDGPVYSASGMAVYLVNGETDYPEISGPAGTFTVTPANRDEFQFGSVLTGADGRIFVNYGGFGADQWIFCYRPVVSNTGAVSGHFFNDINADKKQEKNEPPLRYWQAYADTNNNGVFDVGEPTAYADINGNYTIHNLAAGRYRIREVRQNGWNRTTPPGEWPTGGVTIVKVSANKTVTGISFGNVAANAAKGSISGTVFNDINGDLKQNAGEPGLSGWQVYIDANNNGVLDSGETVATTNAQGHFVLHGLPQGTYRLREVRKSGWARTTPAGAWPLGFIDVTLTPGKSSSGNNFGNAIGNSPFGSVSGFVYNDRNSNGQRDRGEEPLVGYLVFLDLNNNGFWDFETEPSTQTAADGSYRFANISGPVVVRAHDLHDKKLVQTSPAGDAGQSVVVRPSHQLTNINFLEHRQPVPSITGLIANASHQSQANHPPFGPIVVFLDTNHNGKLDAGERSTTAQPITTLEAQPTYQYTFFDLTPGTYTVMIQPQSHLVSNPASLTVKVTSEDSITEAEFNISYQT